MCSRCMLMRTPSVIARLSETELLRDGVFITAVCRCGPLPLARGVRLLELTDAAWTSCETSGLNAAGCLRLRVRCW